MNPLPEFIVDPQSAAPVFATTHWTVVHAAGEEMDSEAGEALTKLCRSYWYPLYAYVRRQGCDAHEAQDLTQEFFARLLERNYFSALDRRKGRFRSWLLASMEHFLAKQWRDARRLKRGGGQKILSLDEQTAEQRYKLEPTETLTAEHLYERRWALTLLEQTMQALRAEFASAEKLPLFERLQVFLTSERSGETYAETARALNMTEGAVKVAVHRLRQRYGELVRSEIRNTVSTAEELEDELRYLLSVLAR